MRHNVPTIFIKNLYLPQNIHIKCDTFPEIRSKMLLNSAYKPMGKINYSKNETINRSNIAQNSGIRRMYGLLLFTLHSVQENFFNSNCITQSQMSVIRTIRLINEASVLYFCENKSYC